jgi:hypothetical protein
MPSYPSIRTAALTPNNKTIQLSSSPSASKALNSAALPYWCCFQTKPKLLSGPVLSPLQRNCESNSAVSGTLKQGERYIEIVTLFSSTIRTQNSFEINIVQGQFLVVLLILSCKNNLFHSPEIRPSNKSINVI